MTKIIKFISTVSLFLIPLYPIFIIYPFYEVGKVLYFFILVEISFFSWLILAIINPRYRSKKTLPFIILIIFLFSLLISDLLGVDPIKSLMSDFVRMDGWILLCHLFAIFLVARSILGGSRDLGMWIKWLKVSVAVAFVISLFGIFQLVGWMHIVYGNFRIDATFGNPSYLAIYLLAHIFISLFLYNQLNNKDNNFFMLKVIYIFLVLLFLAEIIFTGTRSALIGLFFGVLSMVTLIIIQKKKNIKASLISTGVIIVFILFFLILLNYRNSIFVKNNQILSRFVNISWNNTSDQSRQFLWPIAILGIKEKPFLGWGQENFNYIFNKNYNPQMYNDSPWFDRAHNVLLDWLVDGGICGLVVYLLIYFTLFFYIWKSNLIFGSKCLLTGLMVAIIVNNFFLFDTFTSCFWLFIILALADSEVIHANIYINNEIQMNQVSDNIWGLKNKMLVFYVIVVTSITLYIFGLRPLYAAILLRNGLYSCITNNPNFDNFVHVININSYQANSVISSQLFLCTDEVLSNPNISNAVKQKFLDLTVREARRQIMVTPKDASSYVILGTFFDKLGQYKEAIPLLEKAHDLMPAKETIGSELALDYFRARNIDKALSILSDIYKAVPQYSPARITYAIILAASGNKSHAINVFPENESVIDLAGKYAESGELDKVVELIQNSMPDVK